MITLRFLRSKMDSISDKKKQRKKENLQEVEEFIKQIPWIGDKFKFSDKMGYNGDGVFGCTVAQDPEFSNLAHEMAHAIEIVNTKRDKFLFSDTWGLRIKSGVEIAGQYYEEANTLQATERECRVVGIQKRIMEMAGDPTAEGLTGYMANVLLNWMPDWIFGGDDKTERLKTRYGLIEKSYAEWPEEKVVDAWQSVYRKLYVSPKNKIKKMKIG